MWSRRAITESRDKAAVSTNIYGMDAFLPNRP